MSDPDGIFFIGAMGAPVIGALTFSINTRHHDLIIRNGEGRVSLDMDEASMRRLLEIVQREVASYDKKPERV